MFMPNLFSEDFVEEFFSTPFGSDFFFNFEGGRRPAKRPPERCGHRPGLEDKEHCGPAKKDGPGFALQKGHGPRPRFMPTDIQEVDGGYELTVDLPGFKKEEVSAEIKNGYLTISASHEENTDEKDEQGNYIRRERKMGSCHRSFYVGEDVDSDAVQAKFEDGVLKLSVPKPEEKVEEKKVIAIEG